MIIDRAQCFFFKGLIVIHIYNVATFSVYISPQKKTYKVDFGRI